MKRLLCAALALLMAAGLAYWSLRDPASGRQLGAAARAATAPEESAPRGEHALRAATPRGAAEESARARAQEREPRSVGAAAARGDAQRVRVVLAADGSPRPGVTIHWSSHEERKALRDGLRAADIETAVLDANHTVVADSEGYADVPRPDVTTWYAIWDGVYYAEGALSKSASEVRTIELHEDWDLEIEVVGPTGALLAGVPVELRAGPRDVGGFLWKGETVGDPPRALLRHAPLRLARNTEGQSLWIDGHFPLREDIAVPVDPKRRPDGPIRLQLPTTGSVRLELTDGAGNLVNEIVSVYVRPVEQDDRLAMIFKREHRTHANATDGVVELPYVELDLRLEATAHPRGARKQASESFDGPTLPGQRVRVELALAETWPVFAGRLVDVGGAPLPDQEAQLTVEASRRIAGLAGHTVVGSASSDRFRSDADGRFRAVVQHEFDEQDVELHARIRAEVAGRPQLYASVALAPPLAEGETELGDVPLEEAPVLVAGVVQDEDGSPVEGAVLRVEYEMTSPSLGPAASNWRALQELQAQSDAQGRFELYGSTEHAALRVVARYRGTDTSEGPVGFAPGARDVVLVLRRAATVAGSFLLPEGAPAWPFRAEVVRVDESGAPRTRTWKPDASGAFVLEDVTPGPWTFRAMLEGEARPLLALADVRVDPETGAPTPALEDLDLRGVVRGLRIDVFDPTGRAVDDGWVRRRYAEGERPDAVHAYSLDAGAVTVWTQEPAIDLLVSVPGYREQVVEEVRGDRRVDLLDAIRVRLQLPAGVPLPPGEHQLLADLRAVGETRGFEFFQVMDEGQSVGFGGTGFFGTTPAFDESRVISVIVSNPGSYLIEFTSVEAIGGGGMSISTMGVEGESAQVEIADTDDGRTLFVEPDRERYRAWLLSLEPR